MALTRFPVLVSEKLKHTHNTFLVMSFCFPIYGTLDLHFTTSEGPNLLRYLFWVMLFCLSITGVLHAFLHLGT